MRLPDFLIIGAAKSATTTLYRQLDRHPQIHMSPEKEPNYFSADIRYQRGLEWYSDLFSAAESGEICGEASTDYTKFPEYPNTAKRIHLNIPDAKLIYVMRNPIDRAYAYYVHLHRRIPYARRTFELYIEKNNRCLDGSNYIMQIEQYLNYFSRSNLLFILVEDLVYNSEKCLTNVCTFLDVDSSKDIMKIFEQPFVANSAQRNADLNTKNYLSRQIKSLPFARQLLKLTPDSLRKMGYEKLTKLPLTANLENPYQRAPMLPETRELLRDYFAEPNRRLSEFLDRDLSFWQ